MINQVKDKEKCDKIKVQVAIDKECKKKN